MDTEDQETINYFVVRTLEPPIYYRMSYNIHIALYYYVVALPLD
jgi:hypothetical protein